MTWLEEVKKCHDEIKCELWHPELGCMAEEEHIPYPEKCYLNKKENENEKK